MPLSYALRRRRSDAELVGQLREKFRAGRPSGERPDPAPRLSWCAPQHRSRDTHSLIEGLSVAVELADGRVVVGDTVRVHEASVVVRVLGRPRPLRIARLQVASARVLGEHTHAERAFVKQRQRRGEWLTLDEVKGNSK